MTKTAIAYYSQHHQNTKRLVSAIKDHLDITLIDTANPEKVDLSSYDVIGFASGIYYGKFHNSVMDFAKNYLPQGKKVFLLYTCGSNRPQKYTKAIQEIIDSKGCPVLGVYSCPGFDTFGPFRLIGGIAKGRPNEEDMVKAVAFCQEILNVQ